MDLRQLLAQRGIAMDAAGILAGLDGSTISRICTGQVRARPTTVVKLARALGVNARRMQAICDASYGASELEEALSQ